MTNASSKKARSPALSDELALELSALSRAVDAALRARAGGLALASASVLGAGLAPAALAETFTVNSLADPGDGTCDATECTLREAVDAADANSEDDEIVFESDLSGTIELDGSEISIVTSMTITGPGADELTIDAGDDSRIFDAAPPVDGSLEVSGLTLTNGNSTTGGAITVTGSTATLTLNGVTVQDSESDTVGGGISVYGDLDVTESTISGNTATLGGGGVSARSYSVSDLEVTIESSNLRDNIAAGTGGAIQVYAHNTGIMLDMDNSTVSGNTADSGGGIHASIESYYYYGADANVNISSSTVSGNTATSGDGGGIFSRGGDGTVYGGDALVDLAHSTVTANDAYGAGGGITARGGEHSAGGINCDDTPYYDNCSDGSGNLELDHAILAGNTADDAPDAEAITEVSAEYSLIGILEESYDDQGGNLVGDDTDPVDPLLGDLADNGGPTETHAIGSDSPAYNAGDPDFTPPPDFDQRGDPFARVEAGTIDMGAFELAGPTPVTLAIDPDPAELDEDGGNATLEACLPDGTTAPEDVEVTLSVGGEADPGVDHDLDDGEVLTIAEGDTCASTTVTAIDDDIDEGDESVDIAIDQVSGNFEPGDPDDVAATIVDDDTAGIGVDPIDGLVTSEDGDSDTFEVVLESEPLNDVEIELESDDSGEGTADPGTLTFTPADWDDPQTVTVTGVDDDLVDGDVDYTIVLDPAASGDDNYDGLDPDDVDVVNQDNDSLGASLDLAGSPFEEDGGVATVTVDLNLPSTEDVTVDFSFAGSATEGVDYDPSATSVTIPAGETSASIDLTGIDDDEVEGTETVEVSAQVEGAPDPDSVTAEILDDDLIVTGVDLTVSDIPENPDAPQVDDDGTPQPAAGDPDPEIVISVNEPSPQEVTVTLGFSGEAEPGVDFQVDNDVLTIASGETEARTGISGINNDELDGHRPFTVEIEEVENAVLDDPPPTAEGQIIDDELTALDARRIPTLSPLGLILLPLLLPLVAWRVLRKRRA